MKKKLIYIAYCILCISFVYSVDWQTELKKNFISETSLSLGGREYGNIYTRENSKLRIKYNLEKFLKPGETFYSSYYEDSELVDSLDIFSDFDLKDDGFLYAVIANEPVSIYPLEEVPFILGDIFSFAIPGFNFTFKIGSEGYSKWLIFDGSYENKKKIKYPFSKSYNDFIKDVSSSSYLIEKSKGIEFNYSGVCLDWYIIRNTEWPQDMINPYCFPWVENATDGGIGEWIEFDLSSPQSITYILNGFVDGNRMHLYKANSRIKEAEVSGWTEKGKEIKQNVHFEDFVYFKTIQFSEKVTKFRITIKETYPGEKWQDTAISAVMFPVSKK